MNDNLENNQYLLRAIDEVDEEINIEEQKSLTQFEKAPLQLRCGQWFCFPDGVYRLTKKKENDEPKRVYASYQQILISGIIEDIETNMIRYVLSFSVPCSNRYRWKNIDVDASMCSTKRNIVKLADIGVEVTDGTAAELVRYLSEQIRLNRDLIPRYSAVSHMGWINGMFFPFDESIRFSGENVEQKIVDAIQMQKGYKEDWIQTAEEARKNFDVRIILDASLASVLIKLINTQSFVMHIWGKSGCGKTVALHLAASIWGKPVITCTTANSTINALSSRAALHKNIPLLVDEMQLAAQNQDKIIYQLSEGCEKERLGKDSKKKEQKEWQLISITNGERPLLLDGSGAGAVNRLIELEVKGQLFNNFQKIIHLTEVNYGHAGRIFVEYCKRIKPNKLREEYEEICKELQNFGSTGKQINNVAVLILADRIAGHCLFEKEDALSIEQVGIIMKDAKEVSSAYRAQEFILNWIAMNRNHFINTEDQYPGGQFFGKIENSYCWINATVLKNALTESGFNFDSVKKEWSQECFLIKNSAGKYVHQTTIKSVRSGYVKLDMDKRDKDGFCVIQQEKLPFL